RCGWAVAKPEVASVLAKVKAYTDTGQFMAVQAAGVAALESYDEWVPGNVAVFKQRRDAAVKAFRAAGFTCDVPRATMYLWIALSVGVHVIGIAALAALTFHYPLASFLGLSQSTPKERVQYVAVKPRPPAGNGSSESARPPKARPAPLFAPSVIPRGIPAIPRV